MLFTIKMDEKIIDIFICWDFKRQSGGKTVLEGRKVNALKKYSPFELYYFKVFVNIIHIIMNK